MVTIRVLALLLLGFACLPAQAASLDPDDDDCASILQRWAENPGSVPQRMVDLCKEKMADAAPPASDVPAAPPAAATDPCTGPNAADSVLCWGPWANLAPAAGGALPTLDFPDGSRDCENGLELDGRCVAQLIEPTDPILPLCEPGAPCGFATIVDGITSSDDVEDTDFVPFDLDPDGTGFVVDPGGDNEINSVPLGTNVQPRPDGYENLRANGTQGDQQSRLIARVIRDDDQIQLAADVWTHGNRQTGAARSGYFAWGTATSLAGLNSLNGNGVSVRFAGPMSVDKATNGAMTVNFGNRPTWTGTWTNPNYSFGAGGAVSGVNLISNPGQFTSNVQSGSVVQGALLGEPGRQGITHIIDVRLNDIGRIKDVGLLRQLPGTPVIDP
jgi:hypothetical protein